MRRATNGRGLLLDLDGTLADSLGALKNVYRGFVRRFGGTPTEREFDALNGPPLAVVVTRLKATYAIPDDCAELTALYAGMIQAAQHDIRPAKGAHELLERAEASGWRVCVVTSSTSALARGWLERSGLAGRIAATVGGDEVSSGKPAPEPYLRALELIGASAERSLAVEDSPAGAASAVGAGVETLVLGAARPGERWPQGVTFIGALSDVTARL